MKATRHWYGNGGGIVLELYGDSLVKHERSRDRLKVLSQMGHAVDEDALQEALLLGATEFFINEDGRRVVWRASLSEVMPKSKIMTLAGIRRRCFDLRHFAIVEGLMNAPSWYTHRPAESKPNPEPKGEQLVMFAPTAGEIRLHHETQGGR